MSDDFSNEGDLQDMSRMITVSEAQTTADEDFKLAIQVLISPSLLLSAISSHLANNNIA